MIKSVHIFKKKNLNSVKHLYIVSKKVQDNFLNYFPNANQLSIRHYFKTLVDSITATLRHMIPLRQLAKLVIECGDFPMEDLIKLLRFTSNKNEIFQYIIRTWLLKTGINRKETRQIFRLLLSKTHNRARNLFYLRIRSVPKVHLKEAKVLIESKNLLNNCSIKYINDGLH
ncbi:unnamed protein product [Rotaria sordida]|uniref:Uncharacterized protein n=1 Tax=Rotaria sordida TaxID=392033 RepID=A0A815A1P2_9BILA|nr:unnamed protein product [Rotaria sordida]CAF1251522.1 unnamed protein product [Rotaria sordida]CAF1532314.1 unnamed protein product [Rotaria sordida]CAF1532679.1 unnamed protein product [Rotaria sordida]